MRTRSEPTFPSDITLWPQLSFHYGLSYTELCSMPRFARELYIEKLPQILALHQLRAFEASAYPHMEDAGRREVFDTVLAAAKGEPLPEEIEEQPKPRKIQRHGEKSETPSKLKELAAAGIAVVAE